MKISGKSNEMTDYAEGCLSERIRNISNKLSGLFTKKNYVLIFAAQFTKGLEKWESQD
jgi:hypothetical protein